MRKKFDRQIGLMNKNFEWGDEVEFFNTACELNGIVGKIVGKPNMGLCDFYLVDIGEQELTDRPDSVIFISEACIRRV